MNQGGRSVEENSEEKRKHMREKYVVDCKHHNCCICSTKIPQRYGLLFDIYCSTEDKPQLLCVCLLYNTTIKLKFVVECNIRLKFSTYSFVPLRKNGINFAEPSFSAITRPKLWFITKYTYTAEEMLQHFELHKHSNAQLKWWTWLTDIILLALSC